MTIIALAGTLSGCATTIPKTLEIKATAIPMKNVDLNECDMREAIAEGKIMNDVMSKTPIERTPMTMNNDVSIARKYRIKETLIFKKVA